MAAKYHSIFQQRIRGVLFKKGQEVKVGKERDAKKGQIAASQKELNSWVERGRIETSDDAKKRATAEKKQAADDAKQAAADKKADSSGDES